MAMSGQIPARAPASGDSVPNSTLLETLLAQRRFSEAAGICGRLIDSNPDDHTPYFGLARLADIAGDPEKTAKYCGEAILRDSSCGPAYELLSGALRKLGQLEFAASALEAAMALNVAGADGSLRLGDLYYEMGDRERAALAYGAALERDPNCGRSRAMLKLLADSPPSAPAVRAASGQAVGKPIAEILKVRPAWREVHLAAMAPPGYAHWAAFEDLMMSLRQSFLDIGANCTISANNLRSDAINIVFGAHLITSPEMARIFPPNTVFFNLEQTDGFGIDRFPVYMSLLQRFPIWDYSPRNIKRLRDFVGHARISHLAIGFSPAMERISAATEPTTDILFYGSLNPRRGDILDRLRGEGINVRQLFAIYGEERDAAIADAKIVLNLHFYEDSIHEIVRTSYLLANRKAVVSECNATTEIDPDIKDAMCAVPYDGIVDACIGLLKDDSARAALEKRGYEVFSRRNQTEGLLSAIAATRLG